MAEIRSSGPAGRCGAWVLAAALAVPGAAEAACFVSLAAPADDSVARSSPEFRWGGDCAEYRVLLGADATLSTARGGSGWIEATDWRMSESDWDKRTLGAWGGGVYWTVQGRAADGSVGRAGARHFVAVEVDWDDDGSTVEGGDCDDRAPDVHPGAYEAYDGVDNDCDGVVDEYGDGMIRIYQEGSASIAGDVWAGTETYGEWIGAERTCDVGFATSGLRTDACEFCDFTFDVTYDVLWEDNTPDCAYIYTPGDGETWQMGYYSYYGYGFMLYYVGGYGFAFWGNGTWTGTDLDYYYEGYHY